MSETSLASQVAEQSAELMALRNDERWKRAKIKELEGTLRRTEDAKQALGEMHAVMMSERDQARERIKELEAAIEIMKDDLHESLCPVGGDRHTYEEDCAEVFAMYEKLDKLSGMSGEMYVKELERKIKGLKREDLATRRICADKINEMEAENSEAIKTGCVSTICFHDCPHFNRCAKEVTQ